MAQPRRPPADDEMYSSANMLLEEKLMELKIVQWNVNKPDSERQIPVLSHLWNLGINLYMVRMV